MADASSLAGVDAQVLAAERLDLVGDLGPRVGGVDDRAEAAGRADRRQAGDARAGDEHLGRRDLAGGRDLAGEEAPELVRGLDTAR